MTYIEFFSNTELNNVFSCFAREPHKIIYLGVSANKMKKFIERCQRVFDCGIRFEYIESDFQSLSKLTDLLSFIVEHESDCVFDLSGGPDLALVAMGIVVERYKEMNIKMHRFNLLGGQAMDCDGMPITTYSSASMTVDQLISIHGGCLAWDRMEEPWKLNEDLIYAITSLWDIVKVNPGLWNLNSSFLAKADSVRSLEESTDVRIVADFDDFPDPVTLDQAINRVRPLLRSLKDRGLVVDYSIASSPFIVEYASSQIRRILSKAGNILELKTYAAAMSVCEKDDTPVYSDCINGAVIDWDVDNRAEGIDPTNEIDLILLKGFQPVFISCKNGGCGVEELYKFNTVTSHFGGKYAKKVLLSTQPIESTELILRAKELGIRLIDNIMAMTDIKFEKMIANLYNG